MKKIFKLCSAITVLFLFSGCTNNTATSNLNDSEVVLCSDIKATIDNPEKTIEDFSNFSIPADFILSVPNNLTYISEFTLGSESRLNSYDFYNDFVKLFNYVFPDHSINDLCFRYSGANSEQIYDDNGNIISDYKTVKESYDNIIANKEDIFMFIYDEGKMSEELNNPVTMQFTSPLYNDMARFNRGECCKIAGVDISELFYSNEHFKVVGKYQPDSNQKFMMLDKEISIKEAVDFFENYINNLPCQRNQGYTKTIVSEVEVLSLDDKHHGYNFLTTTSYNNLPFDRAKSGEQRHTNKNSENYNYVLSTGLMIKSNEVDYVNGITRCHTISDEKRYENIISFNNAVSIVSNSITSGVVFDVKKIELVYCSKFPNESITTIETALFPTSPAWKFTLFNPNDNLNYVCYINAIDGSDFRYYTTESKE